MTLDSLPRQNPDSENDIRSDFREFRGLVREQVELLCSDIPEALQGRFWIIRCYRSFDVFSRMFENQEKREEMLDTMQELSRSTYLIREEVERLTDVNL